MTIVVVLSAIVASWIAYIITSYVRLGRKYDMKLDWKSNLMFIVYAILTGKKIFYCKQKLNPTTEKLLAERPRSLIAEWRIGMHPFQNENILAVPVTMNSAYHREAIRIFIPILREQNQLMSQRLDGLIDKVMHNNGGETFSPMQIAEFALRNTDVRNKLQDHEIREFGEIGYGVMQYVNAEIDWWTLFPFMLGFQVSSKRKWLSEQSKLIYRKYMDRELFQLPADIKDEDIPPEKIVMAIFLYGAALFSSINNLTAMLYAFSSITEERRTRLLTDEIYRQEFVKEIIRVYAALPSLARVVDDFDVIFTNINTVLSWNFNWDTFDAGYLKPRPFNSFGFGTRQCAAKGWIEKVYDAVIISLLTRYKVHLESIKPIKSRIAPWASAFVRQPQFKTTPR